MQTVKQTSEKINVPIEQIEQFCRRWHILEFALFGSVLTEHFHAESDVDVLVTFATEVRYTFFDLDIMEEELEAIFARPVDLIDKRAVQASENYLRRRQILESVKIVYQANYA